ncbi:MAG: 4Fe-4S dicluster domain-containing protein [bacterium]
MSYLETGVLSLKDIKIPSDERFWKGPVAVVECVQRIPCNPCVDACSRGAITIQGSVNNTPEVDFEKCNGCGICIANCPGLAIFLVDKMYEGNMALVGLPYEFLPLPEEDEEVVLLDRAGEECGQGKVTKVRNAKAQDRTPIVFLAVDKALAMKVRFFRRKKE